MEKSVRLLASKRNDNQINSVYVFGERNSGTNYLSGLIMKNCMSATRCGLYNAQNRDILGWKHGFPAMKETPSDVLAIAVYREPIAWLHSLCRAPWHTAPHLRKLPFSQFIRREWVSVIDDAGFGIDKQDLRWRGEFMSDRNPKTGLRFANAMQLRNAKNDGFASLTHRFGNVVQVNYEAVHANPEGFLNGLCNTYGLLRQKVFDPILYDRCTPGRGVFVTKPVPMLCEDDANFIRAHINIAGEAQLGYHLNAPADLQAA